MFSYVNEVIYSNEHWALLEEKRKKGLSIINTLNRCGYALAILHGSTARGDITKDSDVDIALLYPYSIGMVKACLEGGGYAVYNVKIVQPTPRHTPKVYLYLDPFEEQVVSIPLSQLEPIEVEYYRFSGFVTKEEILGGKRVKGVNKRLVLIVPTGKGHVEVPVVGNEGYVSRVLQVGIDVVKDRVEALTRRREEGHTGLFVEVSVPVVEEVEQYVERLCRDNTAFRKAVSKYGVCL